MEEERQRLRKVAQRQFLETRAHRLALQLERLDPSARPVEEEEDLKDREAPPENMPDFSKEERMEVTLVQPPVATTLEEEAADEMLGNAPDEDEVDAALKNLEEDDEEAAADKGEGDEEGDEGDEDEEEDEEEPEGDEDDGDQNDEEDVDDGDDLVDNDLDEDVELNLDSVDANSMDGEFGDDGDDDGVSRPARKRRAVKAAPKKKKATPGAGASTKKKTTPAAAVTVTERPAFVAYERRIRTYPASQYACLDDSYLSDYGLTAALAKWEKRKTKTGDATAVHHAQVLARVATEHNIRIKGFTSENKKQGAYEKLPCGNVRESEGGTARVVYIGKLRKTSTGPAALFCLRQDEEEAPPAAAATK